MTSTRYSFVRNKCPDDYILSYGSFPVSNLFDECVSCRFSTHKQHENICAFGTEHGKVLICDVTAPVKDREEFVKSRFSAGESAVFDLCFIPEHPNLLLSLCGGSRLELWDIERSSSILFHGHRESVRCASVWPENPLCVLTGSRDGAILVWDLRGKPLRKEGGFRSMANSIDSVRCYKKAHDATIPITGILHLSENYFISSSSSALSGIRIWDLRYQIASSPIRTLSIPQSMAKESGVASMCWDRFRSSFFALCTDNAIYEYVPSLNSAFPVRSFRTRFVNSFFVQCDTSPLSDHLLCGSSLSKAFIWNLQEHRKCFQNDTSNSGRIPLKSTTDCLPNTKFMLDGHSREVECVRWSPNGQFIITMDSDVIRIWSRWANRTENGYPQEIISNHRPLKFTYPRIMQTADSEEVTPSSSQAFSQQTFGSESRVESRCSDDNDIQLLPDSPHRCVFGALDNLPALYAKRMVGGNSSMALVEDRRPKRTIVIKSNLKTTPASKIPRVAGHDNFTPIQHKTPRGTRRNLTAELRSCGSTKRKRHHSDAKSPSSGRPLPRTVSTRSGNAKKRLAISKRRDYAEFVHLKGKMNILNYFARVRDDGNIASSSSQ